MLAFWLIGMALATLPFYSTLIPPLSQHFYNLVRMAILADPTAFTRDFVIRWDPMPDLAMDLTVPWLASIMPVEQAARLFILINLVLLTSGTVVLSWVINGRWSVLPLLSFLFVYNRILVRGYANSLFALGLALWALAAHVSLRRMPMLRALVSSFSALAIYLCHLFPLGLFVLVAGGWELGCLLQERITLRRLVRHAAPALLPLVFPLVLLVISSTSQHSDEITFGLLRIREKLKLCLEVLMVGNRLGDALVILGLGGSAILAVARGWLSCQPEWRVTVLALPFVVVMAPFSAFAAYNIIERIALGAVFLLPAILAARPKDHRLQCWVAGGLSLVFVIRIATVAADWRAADQIIQTYRTTLSTLQPGSVLFQFERDISYPSPLRDPAWWNPPLDKVVALATLNGVLVPKLYLKLGQQPVLYNPDNTPLREFQIAQLNRPRPQASDTDLRAWLSEMHDRFPDLRSRFSAVYIAVFDPHRRLTSDLPGTRLISTLPGHRLYEIVDWTALDACYDTAEAQRDVDCAAPGRQ